MSEQSINYVCIYCKNILVNEIICKKCGNDTVKKQIYKSFYKVLD